MYKYKCTAEANADKEAFYGVIGGLKRLYPEMFEDNNVSSDNEFLRREFLQGKNRIMVLYSFSERSVTVFSEDWLGKFYENRDVSEGRFPTYSYVSTDAMWHISGGFFAGSVLAAFFCYLGFLSSDFGGENFFAAVLVFAAIYTVSGTIIRRNIEIPLLKLILCQAGGFITVIVGIVTLNIFVFQLFYYIDLFFLEVITIPFVIYSMCFAVFFLPALEISLLLQAIIGFVAKKNHSYKAAAEEGLEMNNDYKIISEEIIAEKNDYRADDGEKYLR